jgi:hypothetical protein
MSNDPSQIFPAAQPVVQFLKVYLEPILLFKQDVSTALEKKIAVSFFHPFPSD